MIGPAVERPPADFSLRPWQTLSDLCFHDELISHNGLILDAEIYQFITSILSLNRSFIYWNTSFSPWSLVKMADECHRPSCSTAVVSLIPFFFYKYEVEEESRGQELPPQFGSEWLAKRNGSRHSLMLQLLPSFSHNKQTRFHADSWNLKGQKSHTLIKWWEWLKQQPEGSNMNSKDIMWTTVSLFCYHYLLFFATYSPSIISSSSRFTPPTV